MGGTSGQSASKQSAAPRRGRNEGGLARPDSTNHNRVSGRGPFRTRSRKGSQGKRAPSNSRSVIYQCNYRSVHIRNSMTSGSLGFVLLLQLLVAALTIRTDKATYFYGETIHVRVNTGPTAGQWGYPRHHVRCQLGRRVPHAHFLSQLRVVRFQERLVEILNSRTVSKSVEKLFPSYSAQRASSTGHQVPHFQTVHAGRCSNVLK